VPSQDFLNSSFTAPEWAAAFVQDPKGDKGKLLPIKIRDCRPEGLLASIDRIDLIGLNEEEARNELLAGVSLERAKPMSQPAFPGIRSVPDHPRFPGELPKRGALPPGHRVPFLPNAIFTGRQEQLKEIANILLDTSKDSIGVAITGIGGVGKSQLAVELCYRYGRFFQGVHWIQANLNISAEIADCGRAMGLPGWSDKLPEQVAATIRSWQEGGPRLIVLDNAENLKLLNEWMPKLQPCRLLITARRENWPADLDLQTKRLEEFSRSQSIELLRKLAPRLQKVLDNELDKLADYLGDLPLALDLAGRYLSDRTELSIKNYLEELEEAGNALEHTSLKDWVEHNPTNHPTSLVATFALSWGQLGEADELARLLFRTSGYCASNIPIPRQLLAETVRANESDPELDRALRKLESLGLMQPTESGHRIHTMLAEFARLQDRDAEESALPAVAGAIAVLAAKARINKSLEDMVPLHEHLEALADFAEEANLQITRALWGNLGVHLGSLAEYERARMYLERNLKIDEKVYGPDHIEVAMDVNNLGTILVDLGELQEAKKCFERALTINEKAFGPDHPETANSVNNLGMVMKNLGKLREAKKCFKRALQIDEKVFGPNDPEVAVDVNNLGLVLQDMGNLHKAKKCFKRALQIDEKVFGPDHPIVGIRVNNLGTVLMDLGNLQEARKCIERALRIDETTYGPDHPQVALVVNNLGTMLLDLGDLLGAKKCFERALQIDEKVFGKDHLTVARDANNLGGAQKDLGDLHEARKSLERAMQINEKVYGSDHPVTAIAVSNLGSVLKGLGELQGAKKCFQRAPAISRLELGKDHPTTMMIQRKLKSLRACSEIT